jgi:hypothetical protein
MLEAGLALFLERFRGLPFLPLTTSARQMIVISPTALLTN